MKIRIDDEYSNLEGDFNIVLNEYSQNDEEVHSQNNFQDEFEEGMDYEVENNSRFNVEIQYSEEGSYVDSYDDKHREYDDFYKGQGLDNTSSVDYDNKVRYYTDEKSYEDNKFESFDNKAVHDNKDLDDNRYVGDNKFDLLENESVENYINDHKSPYDESFGSKCDAYYEDDYKNEYENVCKPELKKSIPERKGEIRVEVRLENKNGVEIKGTKVNLYSLNGVCPKLHESKLTDCKGEAVFSCLENGCYRVISIVDRRYFEKPIYTSWNEVIIDKCVKYANVGVVNKIKPSCYKR